MLGRDVFIKKIGAISSGKSLFPIENGVYSVSTIRIRFYKIDFLWGTGVSPPKRTDVIEIVIDDPDPRIWDWIGKFSFIGLCYNRFSEREILYCSKFFLFFLL